MTDHHELDREVSAPEPQPAASPSRRLRWLSLGIVGLGLAAVGYVAWTQVKPAVDARRYASVTYEVPTAPRLKAAEGETLLRIDPTSSSLTYEIEETFVGRKTSTATGVTNGIAGDLALNRADLSASRVGDIVVNVEQFRSDNNLRDARIRQDFLSSHRYPLATFSLDAISGLDGALEEGRSYSFTMKGTVAIKDTTAPATFDATARFEDDRLVATATTTAKLSRFDAGPISIAGLVRTEDDVALTLKLVAVDPTDSDVATEVAGPERVETEGAVDAPSFRTVVAPILERSCASCHNTGQMAGKHVRLDTAADAKAISDGIKTVTQTGYMPPWPASDEGVALAHVPKLSKRELADLAAWSEAGGPLDVPADTELEMPPEVAAQQPRKDVTLEIPTYTGVATNTNDYRCFVLDPKITEETMLTGYTFLADQVEELHHAQVFHISDEQLANSAEVDGADGRPGWECYGGPGLPGRRADRVPGQPRKRDAGFAGQDNLVAGWVPGQSPVIFPEHAGVTMHPGDALVMQIHYHYATAPTPDASGLALQLDEPSSAFKELRVVNPLAPVEIPCAPADADEPLCDRDASLADNVEKYGPSGAANEGGLLSLCGHTPEELTKGFDGNVARSSCVSRVPQDGQIVGVLGHMHTLGKSFRLTLAPGTDREQILLDIPEWSFDWQMNYGLAKPLRVKAGEEVLMECSWDRRVDPDRPPKYVVFAEGTEDEMCFGTYGLVVDD